MSATTDTASVSSQHAACIARVEELERERVSITNAVRLVPGASVDSIVSSIKRLKHEISDAKETLARFCPEADPTRCSLASVVSSLVGDVLEPSAVSIADAESRVRMFASAADNEKAGRVAAERRVAELQREVATLRGILAAVPPPEDDL